MCLGIIYSFLDGPGLSLKATSATPSTAVLPDRPSRCAGIDNRLPCRCRPHQRLCPGSAMALQM